MYAIKPKICDPIHLGLLFCNKLSNDTKFIKNLSDTFENTSFTKCEFLFIFFIFYTLFCSLSQNKPGRQDVPFVVLGHIVLVCLKNKCILMW